MSIRSADNQVDNIIDIDLISKIEKNIISSIPSFLPTDLPELELWLDANEGVLNSVGPDVEAANNETVEQWNNKASGKPNPSQDTEGSRPIFKSDVNGRKAVYFSGDALSNSGFSTFTQQYSYYLVADSLDGSQSASLAAAIRLGTSTLAPRGVLGASATSLGANNGTSKVSSILRTALTGAVWSARFNIASSQATVGKNLTSELLTSIGTASANQSTIIIGAANTSGSSSPINSNFSEVLVYNALHDETTANQVINYLIQKWNISV